MEEPFILQFFLYQSFRPNDRTVSVRELQKDRGTYVGEKLQFRPI